MSTSLTRVRACSLLLWSAINKINRAESRQGDLTFAAFSILQLIHTMNKWDMRMQDISRINGVSKSTVTDYIDNLEKKGYVVRVKNESDQRGMIVRLTETGEQLLIDNDKNILGFMETCSSRLSEEEMKDFAALFSKFLGGVGSLPFPTIMENILDIKK